MDKKSKIVKLFEDCSTPDDRAANQTTLINSNGNILGNNNMFIKTERHTTRVTAEPKPGVEHITEKHVRRLHDLKDEIVRLESIAKRNPATHQRVWANLNKKMGVGAMRMIFEADFKKAEKYLLTWIAQLTDRSAVKKGDPSTVEKRRITYIKTNIKKLNVENKVYDYMEKHFGVRSLKELPNLDALERIYRYVASLKKNLD